MQVVTEAMPDSHSVTIGFWVDAGSRDETPPEAGASHFLEHLLFKGTESRSAHSIAEDIEAVGGDMNAFTTKEYTAFYTRLIDEDLELGLDILSDIMWAPAFRPDEIDAERQVMRVAETTFFDFDISARARRRGSGTWAIPTWLSV